MKVDCGIIVVRNFAVCITVRRISIKNYNLCHSFCSSCLPTAIIKKLGLFITVFATAESVFWRAEVRYLAVLCYFISVYSWDWLIIYGFIQRLFFLNGEQDLSSFLLADLGIIKYPSYNCLTTDRIFRSRSDLLKFEEVRWRQTLHSPLLVYGFLLFPC